MMRLGKVLWVAAAIAVLVLTMRGFDGGRNPDAEVLLAWAMLALGFPGSLAVTAVFAAVSALLHARFRTTIPVSYGSILISWLAIAVVGYAQWFILLPKLIRRLRTGRW